MCQTNKVHHLIQVLSNSKLVPLHQGIEVHIVNEAEGSNLFKALSHCSPSVFARSGRWVGNQCNSQCNFPFLSVTATQTAKSSWNFVFLFFFWIDSLYIMSFFLELERFIHSLGANRSGAENRIVLVLYVDVGAACGLGRYHKICIFINFQRLFLQRLSNNCHSVDHRPCLRSKHQRRLASLETKLFQLWPFVEKAIQ